MRTFFILILLFSSSQILADFDETQIQFPINESNEEILYGISCRTRDHLYWDVCYSINPQDERLMKSFKFINTGGNVTVPNSGITVGREYEFSFEGLARSDMNLLIWDAPDEIENHVHLKIMYFFPRIIMPAIRIEMADPENKRLIVTLPTEEEVIFNEKSREIISGALKETPMKQSPDGSALAPGVNYTGKGVVVEASAQAQWPIGNIANDTRIKIVTIKKKGYKNCLVPDKELFYTDSKKGGNIFMNKKYITDNAFDLYLKKQCGFSIY